MTEYSSERSWERYVAELKQFRDEQERAWGDIDDVTLTRFLCGESTVQEAAEIKRLMADRPAVRETVEIMQELLGQDGLVGESGGQILTQLQDQFWQTVDQVQELTTRLRVWIDNSGMSISAGLESFLNQPQLALDHLGDDVEQGQNWQIPIAESLTVNLNVSPSDRPDHWALRMTVEHTEETESFKLRIRDEDGAIFYSGSIDRFERAPVFLASGSWQLDLSSREKCWRFPLELK